MQANDIHQFLPNGVKILVLDIETAPHLAYVWRTFKQNVGVNQMERPGVILSWSAKFVGSEHIFADANVAHSDDPLDDRGTVATLSRMLDNADIIVTYNGKKFDIPYFNARCLALDLPQPSPYKHIDLYQVVRANFAFPHKSVAGVAKALGLGEKVATGGFELWLDCMAGNIEAWTKMVEYNKQDVALTEEIYRKLRPWIKNHPNIGNFMDDAHEEAICPKCGGKHVHYRGYARTNVGTFRRFQCMNCGGWGKHRLHEKGVARPVATNEV